MRSSYRFCNFWYWTHKHLVTAYSASNGETAMDGTGGFNTDGCQVIVVTTEEWVDGLPLGECNNHMGL